MFDLNALIPVRIVAALLAVAALMASPAVEAAQCADELSEIAYSVQMFDIDADESPQNESPEQQEQETQVVLLQKPPGYSLWILMQWYLRDGGECLPRR